jgi:hypothetical protein
LFVSHKFFRLNKINFSSISIQIGFSKGDFFKSYLSKNNNIDLTNK